MKEHYVVFVTCQSKDEGKRISEMILNSHLVACVNIVPSIESVYWWEGKLENSSEVLLIMKTKASVVEKLINAIKELHSYSVPEIIALPIKAGNKDYLDWIEKEVAG